MQTEWVPAKCDLCMSTLTEHTSFTFAHRPVSMTPQMAQPAHSAGQMLVQMSRQNGAPQTVAPPSTGSPLHGGPAGGWPGAGHGARPPFNNQVSHCNRIHETIMLVFVDIFSQSISSQRNQICNDTYVLIELNYFENA